MLNSVLQLHGNAGADLFSPLRSLFNPAERHTSQLDSTNQLDDEDEDDHIEGARSFWKGLKKNKNKNKKNKKYYNTVNYYYTNDGYGNGGYGGGSYGGGYGGIFFFLKHLTAFSILQWRVMLAKVFDMHTIL